MASGLILGRASSQARIRYRELFPYRAASVLGYLGCPPWVHLTPQTFGWYPEGYGQVLGLSPTPPDKRAPQGIRTLNLGRRRTLLYPLS